MKRRRQQEIYFKSHVLEKVDEISKQLKDCGDEDELFLMSLVPAFKRLSEKIYSPHRNYAGTA